MIARLPERDGSAQMFGAVREGMVRRDQPTEVSICVPICCPDGAGV
jgi:hypothetical protein